MNNNYGQRTWILSLFTLIVVAAYTTCTFFVLLETHYQNQLMKKANRPYVYLEPAILHFATKEVPERWAFEINVANLGLEPAYNVRIFWCFDVDSSLATPLVITHENAQRFGIVFPGPPRKMVVETTRAFLQHNHSQGHTTFLHLYTEYKDIENRTHHYTGFYAIRYEEGVGLALELLDSDADTG